MVSESIMNITRSVELDPKVKKVNRIEMYQLCHKGTAWIKRKHYVTILGVCLEQLVVFGGTLVYIVNGTFKLIRVFFKDRNGGCPIQLCKPNWIQMFMLGRR